MKFIITLVLLTNFACASSVKKTLSQLSGCFEVQYQFVEDGTNDKLYAPIFEYIRLKENEESTYEHIGQYPLYDDNDQPVVDENGQPQYFSQYHWSEVWEQIENDKWKQIVRGPYEDYRYTCEGKWLLNQFHCHTDKAAKPRRDMKRPYEYMIRINNIQVNEKRWVHNERNQKFDKDNNLYSVEMGWNTYKRVELSKCQPAIDSNAQPLPHTN